MELPDPISNLGYLGTIRVTTNSSQSVLKKAYSPIFSSFASLISFLKASITNFLILPAFCPYLFRAYLRTSSAISAGNLNENTSSSSIDLPPNFLFYYFTFKLYKLNPYFLSNFLKRKVVNFKYYFHLTITCKLTNLQLVCLHGHRGFLFFKSPPFYEGRNGKQERRRITISLQKSSSIIKNDNAVIDARTPCKSIQGKKQVFNSVPEFDGGVFFFDFRNLEKISINLLEKISMNYDSLSSYIKVVIHQLSLRVNNAVLIFNNAVIKNDNAVIGAHTWRSNP